MEEYKYSNKQNTDEDVEKGKNTNKKGPLLSSFEQDPVLPWEENEAEKKALKQSFLSKYWMLIVFLILLIILPFTILKINLNFLHTNFTINSGSQQINGPYLNSQEFSSLFNTNNLNVKLYNHVIFFYNNSYSELTKITNTTYGDSLSIALNTSPYTFIINNITEEIFYINQENITTKSNKIADVIGAFGTTYETSKPIYIYSSFFSQSFKYLAPFIDNKTYNGMEYSIQNLYEPQINGSVGDSYSTNRITFLGVKNNNVYDFTFTISNYNSTENATLNITALVSMVSNFN
ncbi:MAG: hypothetical protein ACP5M9_02460 [Candidatus Micrarchaeia archaeon]